jgi:hypothetical protein
MISYTYWPGPGTRGTPRDQIPSRTPTRRRTPKRGPRRRAAPGQPEPGPGRITVNPCGTPGPSPAGARTRTNLNVSGNHVRPGPSQALHRDPAPGACSDDVPRPSDGDRDRAAASPDPSRLADGRSTAPRNPASPAGPARVLVRAGPAGPVRAKPHVRFHWQGPALPFAPLPLPATL